MKELHTEISPILAIIFNHSLKTGQVPKDWRKANVAPIYKKGSRYAAENYRPVSLTCISCKVMEHIVTSSIMRHLEDQCILKDSQHGFRPNRSCETQLVGLIHELASNLDHQGCTDLLILDFSKAFDRVSHRHLMQKLDFYGIRGPVHSWIKSFLTDRTQKVVLDGESSSEIPVQSGVPQGSVLGPVLFLIYINDMPECLQHSNIRLFADDAIVYREIKNNSDRLKIQEDITHLEKWESDWLMDFNPSIKV